MKNVLICLSFLGAVSASAQVIVPKGPCEKTDPISLHEYGGDYYGCLGGAWTKMNLPAGTGTPTGAAGGKLSGTYPNPGLNAASTDLTDTAVIQRVTPVATLPTAATAIVGRVYEWTGGTAANFCPAAGAGGTGGTVTVSCVTYNGTTWQAVVQTGTDGTVTIRATVLFPAPTTLTDAAPIAWAAGAASLGVVTLVHTTATRALNVSGLVSGMFYTLVVKQDSTGGAAMTGGTGCAWLTPGGLGSGAFPIATTASSINILSFLYDGTNCLMVPAAAYSAM